ncbi:Gamma-aminobutyric acid (GABA) B receptor [Seminavis robusta]|nr:Gamma-aminobutyric acid (GABA) B receptor [Seminavis robusta]|eukprot:Sro513_g157950.1 Gamma-aminobutyric acid (GABA) B receptor (308) ;mRNA; f:55921-57021
MILFVISIAIVIASAVWVFYNRGHAIVINAQPGFLYTICFAAALSSTSIVLAGFDESWGFEQEDLDLSCYSWMWCDALANTLIYGALFTKLWRAKQVFNNKNTVSLWRLLLPGALMLLVVIAVLIAMKLHGSIRWTRLIIDDASEESVGICSGRSSYHYLVLLNCIYLIQAAKTGFMAWRTKPSLSESKWVLAFLLVQSQVILVGAPIIVLLNKINSSARSIGFALLAFSFPVSVCGLIIFPKVLAVTRMRRSVDATSRRGSNVALSEGDMGSSARVDDPLAVRNECTARNARSLADSRVQMVTIDD